MMAGAMITVGSTLVAGKLMSEIPVFIAAFLRFSIAGAVLSGLVWMQGEPLPRLSRREWGTLCVQALLGSVGYAVLLIMGLALTQASDASVIAGTLPAVAAIAALLLLREKIGGWTLVAILLASAGVAVLGIGDAAALGGGSRRWTGNLLVLAAIACEALFLLLNKTIKTPIEPLVMAAAMSVLPMLFCAAPALYQWMQEPGPPLSVNALGAAVYYALVPTVIGFYLWYKGAASASGAQASLMTAVYPLAGLLLSAAALGEAIKTQHWIGMALTVLGITVGALGTMHRGEGRAN